MTCVCVCVCVCDKIFCLVVCRFTLHQWRWNLASVNPLMPDFTAIRAACWPCIVTKRQHQALSHCRRWCTCCAVLLGDKQINYWNVAECERRIPQGWCQLLSVGCCQFCDYHVELFSISTCTDTWSHVTASLNCDCDCNKGLIVSEWVSDFSTAHQHIIGYSVPASWR